jgi:hypothetical protein
MRSFGGGPRFIKPAQREVRYPEAFLDEWASNRNRKPILDFVPLKAAAPAEPLKAAAHPEPLKPAARRSAPALSSSETAPE